MNILMFQGRNVPIVLIDDQPYIKITKINDYFNADLFWSEEKHSIDITYPAQ